MSSERSSGNPTKLSRYSTAGLELATTLRSKIDTLRRAADDLARAGEAVPGLAGFVEAFSDLAADWYHLDEFAGDVGQGLIAANEAVHPGRSHDTVVGFHDATLAHYGKIGYADRDEAIAAAEAMAERMDQLLHGAGPITPDKVPAFIAMAARGQYDPAFAVTFSERVGVDGYLTAVELIVRAHFDENLDMRVSPDGIVGVRVLATMLDTALDTALDTSRGDLVDPSFERGLHQARRLDQGFIDDLVSGDLPDHPRAEIDLALLMRYTDPPTSVAVEVANHRMTPWLTRPEMVQQATAWSRRGGIVTNYATMLSRNPESSALWLHSSPGGDEANIDLVLHRDTSDDADGGEALAKLMEHGLGSGPPD